MSPFVGVHLMRNGFVKFMLVPVAAVSLAGCGINSVPTAEENAKAKWADVQAAFQERANLIPNLAFQAAQNQLSGSLSRLLVSVEQYPQLKSQEGYLKLQDQLEGQENRVRITLRDYNEAVRGYNTTIRTFPDIIGAKIIHGAKPMVPYQATTQGAETAPQLDMAPAA
jgi:LemA protein